jgi:hypothetical protein
LPSSSGSNTTPLSAGATDHQGGGLSAGAKGGIGAGVAVGALVLLGLALLFWKRRHRTPPQQQQHPPPTSQVAGTDVYYPSPYPSPAGMQSDAAEGYHSVAQPSGGNTILPKYAPVSELPSVVPPELQGSPYGHRDMAELGLNQRRV